MHILRIFVCRGHISSILNFWIHYLINNFINIFYINVFTFVTNERGNAYEYDVFVCSLYGELGKPYARVLLSFNIQSKLLDLNFISIFIIIYSY